MLYKKLAGYAAGEVYPFHMPGHKRNPDFMPAQLPDERTAGFPYNLDITEIYDFDDLHCPKGVLQETAKLACALYGSRESFLLTCGSTTGILAAIGAHTCSGDMILADANCHRSVTNAARLFGLKLGYITAGIDEHSSVPCSITAQSVQTALMSNPCVKLVVITSPGYEGVISDIQAIADVVHRSGALLLVDCAHGAHLGFSPAFEKSPVVLGADLVVMSLHKTLPALTQCSLLHICSSRGDKNAAAQMLCTLQTSSPSYVLMASTDYCLRMLETDAARLFDAYAQNLGQFYKRVRTLRRLSVLANDSIRDGKEQQSFYSLDIGKIVIVTKNSNISGLALMDILRTQYKLELERAADGYAIAMTSIADKSDAYTRLADALIRIDKELQ